MRVYLLASVASVAVSAFSADLCETVIVKMNGHKVRVNKSDYDADPKAYGKVDDGATDDQEPAAPAGVVLPVPEGVIIPPAPSAPNFGHPEGEQLPPAGAPVPPTIPAPNAKLVMKVGKKYKIVDATGTFVTGVDGIDEAGYETEAAATTAILALPH